MKRNIYVLLAMSLIGTMGHAQVNILGPSEVYQKLQAQQYAKQSDNTFASGTFEAGAIRRTGNEYEIVPNKSYGETPVIQVFRPMDPHPPKFLQEALKPLESSIPTGFNSVPQYLATDGMPNREMAASLSSGLTPGSIQADWDNMWNTILPGQQKDHWGGTITRFGNQVTYRSMQSCTKGCTFSILDRPMMVASKIPSIRKYWETQHMLPLNGDMDGFSAQTDFSNPLPIKKPGLLPSLEVFLKE